VNSTCVHTYTYAIEYNVHVSEIYV
jgi:hypothetical protein